MKTCIHCYQTLSLEHFHKDKYKKDGHVSKCKSCVAKAFQEYIKRYPERYKESCHKSYLRNKPKLLAYRLEWQRKYRKENAEKWKIYNRNYMRRKAQKHRLDAYGITEEMYQFLKKNQNNSCGICGKMFEGKITPQIDHCHKTGKVRGLLCWNCNIRLGYFESELFVLQVKKYLAREYIEIKNKES